MKLLLIEDNPELITFLKDLLGPNMAVEVALTGREGISQAKTSSYDAIILDLGLPDISGQLVCEAIRKADITTPILVLTGDVNLDTKITLFTCGADDYVTKPFDNSELRARLKAMQRRGRSEEDTSHLLRAGDLVVDPAKRIATRSDKRILLRRKEFDILEYLVRNKGTVVTRSMLINYVWGGQAASWHNTIDVHINHLRDKVDKPFESKLIKTEYGLGYTIKNITTK